MPEEGVKPRQDPNTITVNFSCLYAIQHIEYDNFHAGAASGVAPKRLLRSYSRRRRYRVVLPILSIWAANNLSPFASATALRIAWRSISAIGTTLPTRRRGSSLGGREGFSRALICVGKSIGSGISPLLRVYRFRWLSPAASAERVPDYGQLSY